MWWDIKQELPPRKHPEPLWNPPTDSKLDKPIMDKTTTASKLVTANQNTAVLGRALSLRGELSGNEDLLIEGQFEGTINLQGHCLTVGSNAHIQASIQASKVIIDGSVKGNVTAREKIEIRRTAHVLGDLTTGGVVIEDGASFKGSIDIARGEARGEPRGLSAPAASTTSRATLGGFQTEEN
jgi:cytoskeletal protein CcmA (bactofilin family)